MTLEQLKAMSALNANPYTIIISPYIYERLERHILILKKIIDRGMTKQRWLTSAIREKLEKDSSDTQLPKATTLTMKIEEELEKLMLQRIEYIKQFRFSYSKKQWLVDAIIDKLDRDEEEAEKKLSKTQQAQELTEKEQIKLLKNEVAELNARLESYAKMLEGKL